MKCAACNNTQADYMCPPFRTTPATTSIAAGSTTGQYIWTPSRDTLVTQLQVILLTAQTDPYWTGISVTVDGVKYAENADSGAFGSVSGVQRYAHMHFPVKAGMPVVVDFALSDAEAVNAIPISINLAGSQERGCLSQSGCLAGDGCIPYTTTTEFAAGAGADPASGNHKPNVDAEVTDFWIRPVVALDSGTDLKVTVNQQGRELAKQNSIYSMQPGRANIPRWRGKLGPNNDYQLSWTTYGGSQAAANRYLVTSTGRRSRCDCA